MQLGEVATAQNSNSSQLVQKGIDSYRLGNFQQAIDFWNEALKFYKNHQNPVSEAIVRENLARAYPQIGHTEAAITNWEQVISLYRKLQSSQHREEKIASATTELAQVYSSIGQPKKAIALLCNPEENDNNEDKKKQKDNNENCTKNSILQFAQDTSLEIAILGTLGDAYRLTGTDDYEKAIYYLESGLKKAKEKEKKNPVYFTSLNNSLGNTYLQKALLNYRRALSPVGSFNDTSKFKQYAKEEIKKAHIHLQQSLTNAQIQSDKKSEIKAIESLGHLYKTLEQEEFKEILDTDNTLNKINPSQEIKKLLEQGNNILKDLPRNRERVYTTINLINLQKSTARKCIASNFDKQAEELLDDAINIAQSLKDSRAESFALGEKGYMYECRQEYGSAIAFTEKARVAAETAKSPDSLYLWEWQIGRILKAQNQTEEAIKAYERAINTLEGSTRADILTANRDIQFDFRDSIEPIYRDLVAMKLSLETSVEASGKSIEPKDDKSDFSSILKTIDSLKLAELQNYFGDDCNFPAFNQSRNNLQDISAENFVNKFIVESQKNLKNTAFISTFILEDKTAIILTLPDGTSSLGWYPKKREEVEKEIDQFRINIQNLTGRGEFNNKFAKNIYDWMIGKFKFLQQENHENHIDTLVFIQDGVLRNVPMAALHDGKQFLIQRYAIATIPSLTLTKAEPMNRRNLRVLALGLSQEAEVNGQRFKALSNVVEEVEEIRKKISGKQLLDPKFTYDNLEEELKRDSYPIIHIATHGQFGIRPEDTFIVTGDNNKITFNELDKIIRRFARNTELLELLTLTACETATGDNRSTLGLGGVAVQAGAKSALASLWMINDGIAGQVAVGFYDELLRSPKVSKAKALQTVLIKFIVDENANTFNHPRYWSPFVMIGNWL
ncbi:CHAT domain-containing protein [Tolypothrix sp. LEGE 11397]|nr:tetratricopeptide repeat protein [Tolypothrix sp. PCC 7601]MBE9080761.1 CHAT domain-containing protein [Tolypothrix sp. LEGE 11397]UYD29988.1 CHAT domain-containing protein [Tolypothrix sp. PCC 7712]UYD37553.1 CHAT domain-containing protein [Tolypothrix sp. PCC 7601]